MRGFGMLTAAGAVAMLTASCHPAKMGRSRLRGDRPVSAAARLDCPERQGALRRTSQASDACTYVGAGGEELTLALAPLAGRTPEAAIQTLETAARAIVPSASRDGAPASATALKDDEDAGMDEDGAPPKLPVPPIPPIPPVPPVPRARHDGDHVRLDLPGIHIDADDGGARVRGFGQSIVADDAGAVVTGGLGGARTSIVARDGGAVIRTGGVGSASVDATFLAAAESAGPDGWRAAGFVARGPLSGPLVVPQVRARDGDGNHGRDDLLHDATRLVNRNLGR